MGTVSRFGGDVADPLSPPEHGGVTSDDSVGVGGGPASAVVPEVRQ